MNLQHCNREAHQSEDVLHLQRGALLSLVLQKRCALGQKTCAIQAQAERRQHN